MLALADRANDKGQCFPGVEEIAMRARLTVRGAQKVLRRLEVAKKLRVQPGKGRNGTNLYTILLPERSSPPPPNGIHGGVNVETGGGELIVHQGGERGCPPSSPKPSGTVIEPSGTKKEREGGAEIEVEPPKHWPKTEAEARDHAMTIGCTPEFAVHCWHKAASRGWCDSRGVAIRNGFSSFCKVEMTYEANRVAENGKKNGNGAKRPLSVLDLKTIIGVKREKAEGIKQRFAAEGAMGCDWTDKEKRNEYFSLLREIRTLNDRLGAMA